MSATSQISIVNIISWVLGSGLIAFSINTMYSDYVKQANLILDVIQFTANESMIDTDIIISNSGIEPAKNIRLTLESVNGTIDKPIVVVTPQYYDENIAIEKLNKSISRGERQIPKSPGLSAANSTSPGLSAANSTWVVKVSNITREGTVTLRTLLVPQENNMGLFTFLRYERGYQFAVFTLGEKFHEEVSTESFITKIAVSTYAIIVLAAIALTLPYMYKRIKRLLERKNQTKFILGVANGVYVIKHLLEEDRDSKNMFLFDVWNSRNPEFRQKIINNYSDYMQIDKFYNELKQRDVDIKHNGFNSKELKEHNEKTFQLANNLFESTGINWKNYRGEDKKTNSFLTIALIIVGSIVLFFLDIIVYFTLIPITAPFYSSLLNLNASNMTLENNALLGFLINSTAFAALIIIRGIVACLLLTLIIRFHLSFTNNLIISDDFISYISLHRHGFLNMLGISILISGISHIYLYNLLINSTGGFFEFFNVKIYEVLNPLLFLIEALRLLFLAFIIKRYMVKNSRRIWPEDGLTKESHQAMIFDDN